MSQSGFKIVSMKPLRYQVDIYSQVGALVGYMIITPPPLTPYQRFSLTKYQEVTGVVR